MDKPGIPIQTAYRTHTCGELRSGHAKETVRLAGWVHARRDHGGVIFLDLRDRWGITQLTFRPDACKEAFTVADGVKNEYVVQAEGKVALRPGDMVNDSIPTGEIEIEVSAISVLSTSVPPPFEVGVDGQENEELRLRYRYLDLRRSKKREILEKRDDCIAYIRQYMRKHKFVEIQTPILANTSPEGARDYLVPSRLYPGKFYALPQAPQQFKQLLMVAGFDRYFQIAPCFRDEDPRADRHPGEFYQLDLEMSFVDREDVFAFVEPLMIKLTKQFSTKTVMKKPFPRISWDEAMTMYGTDKPDMRYSFVITPVTDSVANTGFKVFSDVVSSGGVVHALHVPGGATCSRQQIEALTDIAKKEGLGGLAYMLIGKELSSPIKKYLGEEVAHSLVKTIGAKRGDALFFGAGAWDKVCKALGCVRAESARMLDAIDTGKAAWLWVIDFPLFQRNEDTGEIEFSHNPFSEPKGGLEALKNQDPLEIRAEQYDLVLNGYEISSGAIRSSDPETLYRAFGMAGYTRKHVDSAFGALLTAFKHGAPPHGGIAPGIDRLMMTLWDLSSVRDVYAFPKSGKAQDVLMGSPASVDERQLKDLHLAVISEE